MALLQLNLLGGLTLLNQQGQRIDLRVRKAAGLLAFLAMQTGKEFTRDYLAKLFWPESEDPQARHSLRQALADLRKHVDGLEHSLNPQAPRIGLADGIVSVDVLLFVDAARRADVISLQQASSLYQGDFLEGMEIKSTDFEQWIATQRRHLRERMVHVLEELANHALLDGNPAQTSELLHRLLQLEPWHEPAHYSLMELYIRQGRQPAALKQYQTLCEILSTELNTVPSAKTETLYQRITQQPETMETASNNNAPILSAFAQEHVITSTFNTAGSPPLVGRDTELRQIQQAITAVHNQKNGQCFILRGDEGIGKTHLASDCARFARQRNITTHCTAITDTLHSQHDTLAWLARQLFIESGVAPTQFNDPAGLIAQHHFDEEQQIVLCDLLDLPLPKRLHGILAAMDIATRQQRAIHFVSQQFSARLQQQPMMIVLDDIHLADAGLINFFANLAALAQSQPLILLLTTQSHYRVLPHDPSLLPNVTTFDLTPLLTQEATQITNHFPALNEHYRQQCVQQANGNPLYLMQLLLSPVPHTLSMPVTMNESILLRYSRLPDNDKSAIEWASLFNDEFTLEVLQTLLASPHYDPTPLLAQQFIEATDTGYHFRHCQIKTTIYRSLSKPRRNELHHKLAHYFESRDTRQYALHLDAAEDPEAVNAYLRAAQVEKTGCRYETCLRFLDRAFDLCIDTQQRYAIAAQRGEVLLECNSHLLAIRTFEQALKLSKDPQAIARACLGMARGLYARKQYKPALNLLERAYSGFVNSDHYEQLAQIHHYRGAIYLHSQERRRCLMEHKLAVQFAELANSMPWLACCLNGLSQAYYHFAQFYLAEQQLVRTLTLTRDYHLACFEIPTLALLGLVDIMQCRLGDAKTHLDLALTLANWVGNHTQASIASLGLVQVYLLQAQWQHAVTFASLAFTQAEKINIKEYAAYALAYQALADSHLQPHTGEDERVEKAYMLITEHTDKYKTATILAILARTCHDPQRRTWALQEGERMLQDIAMSADKLSFYMHAIESALAEKKWGRAENLADTLIMTMQAEPVPFYILFAERARILAKIGQGDRQETTHAELIFLYHQALQLNLLALLPAYQQALHDSTLLDTEPTP